MTKGHKRVKSLPGECRSLIPRQDSVLKKHIFPEPSASQEKPKKNRIHFEEKTEKLGIYLCLVLVASPTYLPGLCTAEVMVEVLSHGIDQERVFHPAPGKRVPHQTDPPRPSIHALADAIVWVCA